MEEKFEKKFDVFIDEIDAQIQARHLLKHEFYQAWSHGKLSMACLREYAKEYYQHVKAFPTYVSAVHSRTDDPKTRRILLQNLIEEEAGSPNHPELWRDFAIAIGVSEKALESHLPSHEMTALVETFRTICGQHPPVEGISALYAYESQIPDICVSKIQGLKQHYGLPCSESWTYFNVHIEADQEHAAQERSLLRSCLCAENREKVHASIHRVLEALWNFLSGMCKKYHIAC